MLCEMEPGGLRGCFNLFLGSGDAASSGSYLGSGSLNNQLEIFECNNYLCFISKVELLKGGSGWRAL